MVIRMCAPPINFSSARGQLGRMLRLSGFIIPAPPSPLYNLPPPIISSLREQLGMSCPPPVKDGQTRSHLAASTREHLRAPGSTWPSPSPCKNGSKETAKSQLTGAQCSLSSFCEGPAVDMVQPFVNWELVLIHQVFC